MLESRAETWVQAECCLLRQGFEAQDGLEVRAPGPMGLRGQFRDFGS